MPRIAVLAGDGIGPEVTSAATASLAILRPDIELVQCRIGGSAIDAGEPALPQRTLEVCEASDAILLGAVGGPTYDGLPAAERPEAALLALRCHFKLFANLRPVRVPDALVDRSPLRPEIVRGVDLVIVRELTGGLYFGSPKRAWVENGIRHAVDTMAYNETEVRRVARVAFTLARKRRRNVLSVDKSNVLESSRLWRAVVNEVGSEYTDVSLEHMLVDTAAMHLLRDPAGIDVLLTENAFGDILSDEAAMLTGGIGGLPSASLGDGTFGLFEPIAGSAPDIAGRNIANPIGAMLSAAMLLEHTYADTASASRLRAAIEAALKSRVPLTAEFSVFVNDALQPAATKRVFAARRT
jgi:3-isopropylmalate dehydrogenase